MKKTLSLMVLLTFLSAPTVNAATVSDEVVLQIQALTEFVEHIVNPSPVLTNQDERMIIEDSAVWIVASQEENGHFGYEYVPFEGVYKDDDNMVRQAGTLSALSETYKRHAKPDKDMRSTIIDSIAYLEEMTIKVDISEDEFWCVLRGADAKRCDLGTSALALVGILNLVEAEPALAERYEEHIEGYLRYLVASKRDGAGFSNRYITTSGFSDEESPFYNGEAMLALVRYYQFNKDEEIKTMLHELFSYLSVKEYESPLYLWIMAALKDMQRLWPNDDFVAYAKNFTEHRLADAARNHATTHNYCAPVEGMASAYSVLEAEVSKELLTRLYREIEFWLGKTAWLQLDADRPYRVAATSESGNLALLQQVEPALAHGGFLTGETELTQRIDFTQHCLSAYTQKYVDIDKNEL